MSENTKIEWCDHTFNPWTGCMKVSPGCDHCYAEGWSKRAGAKVGKWGAGAPRVRTSVSNWRKPLQWNSEPFYACSSCGWRGGLREVASTGGDIAAALCPTCAEPVNTTRQRVFCASLADVFDNEVPQEWRNDLWALIEATPHLDWLLLTKRIGNVGNMLPVPFGFDRLYPNVWLGATVVNQEEADRDIPKLLATPARVRFLSMEPLLGMTVITRYLLDNRWRADGSVTTRGIVPGTRLDWVIAGGESGPGARPSHPDWYRSLRDQCAAAGVPFLFKQWGEYTDLDHIGNGWNTLPEKTRTNQMFLEGKAMVRIGKKAAGRLLDGITHDGFPS